MASIEFAPEVAQDFDRIIDHLLTHDVVGLQGRISEIVAAIHVLEKNPQIGRPIRSGKRELVIGRGARGYVALYLYVPEIEICYILAIKSQREAGYMDRPQEIIKR